MTRSKRPYRTIYRVAAGTLFARDYPTRCHAEQAARELGGLTLLAGYPVTVTAVRVPAPDTYHRALSTLKANLAVTLRFHPNVTYFHDPDTAERQMRNHCKWLEARRWMWRNNIKELRYEHQLRK